MPVFHSQRIIHIHNPRCGGSSINAVLWKNEAPRVGKLKVRPANYHLLYGLHRLPGGQVIELDHLDYREVKSAVAPWIWDTYHKFVVVRHPWDKFVSEYRRKHQRGDRRYVPADRSFGDYCSEFLTRTKDLDPAEPTRFGRHQFADSHFIPQWRFAGNSPNNLDKNVTVLKLEDLDKSWSAFLAGNGFARDSYTLPRKNSQAESFPPGDFAVASDIAIRLEKFYADDYRVFGYTPRFSEASA